MADVEIVYPGNPFGLGVRGHGDMASVYITDDDTQLRIVSCNAATGVVVGFQGLRLDSNGVPQPIVETHTPATNRTVATQNYKIGKGTLLRLTAFVSAGTPLYGQTYVLAQLVRGISGPTQVLATLIGGYITVNQALGFPGSPVRSSIEGGGYTRMIAGTTPAAGAEIHETVPTNARWELLELNLTLTASAVVNTRIPRLFLNNSGRVPAFGMIDRAIQANEIVNWVSWEGAAFVGARQLSNGHWQTMLSMPFRTLLLAADFFSTNTDLLDAGDQWAQPTYLVREWLEF